MKRLLLPLICLFVLFLAPEPASAANPKCEFTVEGMNFGRGDPARDRNLDMTVGVGVECSQEGLNILGWTMPSIKLCIEMGPDTVGGDTAWRHLIGPTLESLRYNLYTSADRATVLQPNKKVYVPVSFVWRIIEINRKGKGSIKIAGRMPPRQSVPDGLYTANVPMTITYYEDWGNDTDCSDKSERTAQRIFKAEFKYISSCQLGVDSHIDFGNVLDLNQALVAEGRLSVNCDKNLPYTISLGRGNNTEISDGNARFMSNGTEKVRYELFQDSQRTRVWGDGLTDLMTNKRGTGSKVSIPVYAQVPKQTTPAPGTYTDHVIVKLEYK
jgi:spore coat protein U-like protein